MLHLKLHPCDEPIEVQEALVESTRKAHLRMLRGIQENISDFRHMPLDKAIINALLKLKKGLKRKWMWNTHARNLGNLQGAFARLPQYSNAQFALKLAKGPTWRDHSRFVTARAREEHQRSPVIVTTGQVAAAVRHLRRIKRKFIAAALILAWITTARIGCVLQLAKEDLELKDNGNLSVTFRRGKGAKARGSYTVHTVVTGQWLTCLKEHLKSITKVGTRNDPAFLFPATSKKQREQFGVEIRQALRVQNPDAEQKSIRRSAIQAVAMDPSATREQLMEFTGHKSVSTLLRYLGWGKINENMAKATRDLAKRLQVLYGESEDTLEPELSSDDEEEELLS
jgi:hypothetical protein